MPTFRLRVKPKAARESAGSLSDLESHSSQKLSLRVRDNGYALAARMAGSDSPSALSFGNYEVLVRPDGKPDELGRGGFGRTYRARHRFLDIKVALKVIHDRLAFDEEVRKRFLKEAREHARLDHPGIARLREFGEREDMFYYAVELCHGGNLKDLVGRRGPVPPRQAMELIRQAAEALHCAHSHGILHRDVKPTNLLLARADGSPPQVKLIDFGLVKRMFRTGDADESVSMDLSASSQFSPAFASPEQVREKAVDERTDVFSLGMTAWFLVAGDWPVEGNIGEIIAERLGEESYEGRLPSCLTGPLRAVVAKMVEKDVALRWRNFAEFLPALSAAMNARDEPVPGTEMPPGEEPPRRTDAVGTLEDRFELNPVGSSPLGTIYHGVERSTGATASVIRLREGIGASDLGTMQETVRALATERPPGVVPLRELTEFADGWGLVEERVEGPRMGEVLRGCGAVPLPQIAPVLWKAAEAIDALLACGIGPGTLEDALLTGVSREAPVDWSAATIWIPANLLALTDDKIADPDLTREQIPDSPIRSFAALIYHAVGGRKPDPRAFHSPESCVPVPGLSSEGNVLLASCLVGQGTPVRCRTLLAALLTAEGLPRDHSRRPHSKTTAVGEPVPRSAATAANPDEQPPADPDETGPAFLDLRTEATTVIAPAVLSRITTSVPAPPVPPAPPAPPSIPPPSAPGESALRDNIVDRGDAAPSPSLETAIPTDIATIPSRPPGSRRRKRAVVAAVILISVALGAWLIPKKIEEMSAAETERRRKADIAAEERSAREKEAAEIARKLDETKAAEALAAREKEAAEAAKKLREQKAAELAAREKEAAEKTKQLADAEMASEKAEAARITREKEIEEAKRKAIPANATKDQPFVNRLGMRFVPVPGTKVLFCCTETRVRDFRAYAEANAAANSDPKGMQGFTLEKKGRDLWEWKKAGGTWEDPHYAQNPDHPVVCVSTKDAEAFCQWLSAQDRAATLIGEHDEYRLPTDEEWSAAAGSEKFPWGSAWPPPADAGNFAGLESRTGPVNSPKWNVIAGFKDTWDRTAPVAQFAANQFGLHDMAGNVWEWCSSHYLKSMNSAAVRKQFPLLAREKAEDGTRFRVLRGASWGVSIPAFLQSSYHLVGIPSGRSDDVGFRVVLALSGNRPD